MAGVTTFATVTPAYGPPEGGTPCQLRGSGFATVTPPVSVVAFSPSPLWTADAVPVPFRVVDDNTIETTSPPGGAGQRVYVHIFTDQTRSQPFTYQTAGGSPFTDRGRWRVTLHNRQFAPGTSWAQTIVGELTDARGRRLTQAWNSPAEFTFTLDGASKHAGLVRELQTDVMVWRADDDGTDRAMFRGIVDHSEDQYDADSGVVTFVCHDYLAMLLRRLVTRLYAQVNYDQDNLVMDLVAMAVGATPSAAGTFGAASYLPITQGRFNPDGTSRITTSLQYRDRTYLPSTVIGTAFDELARVNNGFDYDLVPSTTTAPDTVRIFYPSQGIDRSASIVLAWGSSIAAFTRTVASDAYANYQRVLGNNGSADPNVAQVFSEAWTTDATSVAPNNIGLWMNGEQAADVAQQGTLNQQAQGDLNQSGLVVPTYTVTLTPGTYRRGWPNMGDLVGLVLNVGRLNVNTNTRVMGMAFDIDDDGVEGVGLTLGRSPLSLFQILTAAQIDVDALARR